MSAENLTSRFGEVLDSDDVDALKMALQNLIVLFETQNRNYMELKQQLKTLKLGRPAFQCEKGDTFTIDADDAQPSAESFVEGSYELLAMMRSIRKANDRTMAMVKGSLTDLIDIEDTRTSSLYNVLEQAA